MRIALVSQEYPPETAKGGIGTQTWAKAHGLSKLGHEVHVISRAVNGEQSFSMDNSVHVTRIPGTNNDFQPHTEPADWINYSGEVAKGISALHKKTPLDLVEFPEWASEGFVHLINQTEWNHIPTVIQLHGPLIMFAHTMNWPDVDSSFFQVGSMMERSCIRLADAVYSSSQCSIQWCHRHYGLDPANVPIIHTGVDCALFQPLQNDAPPTNSIAFVGKLVENKGVRVLVEASCNLADQIPDLQLELIGKGEPKLVEELNRIAIDRGHGNLLKFPGFVSRDNLPRQLMRSKVFAAPSIYEGGPGFVYLEAMACGLPVIACKGSGAAEAIGDNGVLIPPGDVKALTNALRELLTNESHRKTMANRGYRHVTEHANSEQCIKQIEQFYEQVANQKPTGGTQ